MIAFFRRKNDANHKFRSIRASNPSLWPLLVSSVLIGINGLFHALQLLAATNYSREANFFRIAFQHITRRVRGSPPLNGEITAPSFLSGIPSSSALIITQKSSAFDSQPLINELSAAIYTTVAIEKNNFHRRLIIHMPAC